ncbi:DUF1521 domain-containing protein [Paraburkholderia phytofirmans]|uniref:DUF1521 domain-containing protein n=1 Tax=Paraburkholderia phytofirmans TaxID=261302 RepID=A0ABW9BDZ9_9BURK
MQATFDNRTHASFSDMQSSFMTNRTTQQQAMVQPMSPALFGPVSSSLQSYQFNSSSFSQQSSQTRNGMSSSTSMSSFQQAVSNRGFEQSFSFNSTQVQESFGKASHRGNDRSDRCAGQQDNWSNTQVNDNKSTIDLGNYKLDLNKKDSSMLLTDKKSGETTKVWGDPHIDSNGTSNMFNGPLSLNLSDGTKITVGTQGKGNVSYADKLTITKGNDAYLVNGLSEKDSNPLTVQHTGNGRQLDAMTPDGYSLVANRNGKGWIDPQTGHAPTAADFKKH